MAAQRHDPQLIHFASDNYAGVHPKVLEAINTANLGHVPAYGDDPYSAQLTEVLRSQFGEKAEVFPVFNGTGANVVALQALTPRWGTVVTAESAHIHADEQAAPERVGGLKLITLPTEDGRLTPQQLRVLRIAPEDVHRPAPAVVSLSNSTEHGTVYSPAEYRDLARAATERGLLVHLDGARLANAAVANDTDLRTLSAGAAAISLGGTKLGGMIAEAVVVPDPDLAPGLAHIRKYSMQLASKQRFISTQLLALFEGELWRENAHRANQAAAELAQRIADLPGCEITQPVQANAVFARLPEGVADRVRATGLRFYDWPGLPGVVRLMTAWDTTTAAIDRLINAIRTAQA